MSLVTLIRDYADVVNSTEQLNGYTISSLTSHTTIFLLTVIKNAVLYCFTFNWLRDLSYFCLTPPLLVSSFTNIAGGENQPLHHLLAFSDSNFSTGIGLLSIGFFNGCFSCLHLSAAHLLTIQRMLVQGVPAGFSSAFGAAIGQFSFLACVLFGLRGFLFPWLALEPLHFLVGTGILFSLASTMAQDRRTPTVHWSAKSSLLYNAFTSFLLTWCEQTAIFQWVGNFSFGAEPTLLETAPSLGSINSAFQNVQFFTQSITYLVAFFLGSVLGAFFIGFFSQRCLEFVLRYKGIAVYYGLVKQANLPIATLVFAFGFGSLPYYGFDYLITKGFGFVPNEPFFQQTLFSPINLVSKTSQTKEPSQSRLEDQLALLFTLEGERSKSFAVDTTPFDDGQYLKINQKRPQAFEDLNYRGEHLWTNRLSRISNIREQANQTQSSFLGPVFSWMRSFLWGDEATAGNTTTEKTRFKTFESQAIHQLPERGSNPLPPEGPGVSSNQTLIDSESNYATDQFSKNSEKTEQPIGSNNLSFVSWKNNLSSNSFDTIADSLIEIKGSTRRKELSLERKQLDNYVKEFDRHFDKGFSNFSDADPYSLIEVEDQWQEKRIKEKCSTNPIYKFLLSTEIDSFLARQPNSHWLSPKEELLLLKKRQLLSNYYDTLAFTNQVSTSDAFDQLIPKSYSNGIYNHQFKGTLKVARRLFSVTKGTPPNEKIDQHKNTRAVKFDQPLFSKKDTNAQQTLFHEELSVDQTQDNLNAANQVNAEVASSPSKVDKEENRKSAFSEKKDLFSLEQAQASPLYAGWDEQLRKFTITNRFQSRALAGYTFTARSTNTVKNGNYKTTIFTTWPIPNPLIKQSNDEATGFRPVDAKDRDQLPEQGSGSNQRLLNNKVSVLDENDLLDNKNLLTESIDYSNQKRTRLAGTKDSTKVNTGTSSVKSTSNSDSVSENFGSEIEKKKVKESQKVSSVENKMSDSRKGTLTKNSTDNEKIYDENLINKFLPFMSQKLQNRFLFQTATSDDLLGVRGLESPATNDMVNTLLQWQKLIKENKQLSKEDKAAAKEKIFYWPENVHRAYWSTELIDNELEVDESIDNASKKQNLLWEFTPPCHGGFVWAGNTWKN